MPPPPVTTTAELNKTVFECFSPDMSDDEEEPTFEDNAGAFPSSANSSKGDDHIFTDEPFGGGFYSLQVVNEGSKETMTGSSGDTSRQEELMTVSTSSSETPAVDNTGEGAALRKLKQNQEQPELGMKQSPAISGSGLYPYNIYQSLSKPDTSKKDRGGQEPGYLEKNNTSNTAPPRVSTTHATSPIKKEREDNFMPPQITPMSLGEESSVMSDQQSQVLEAASIQPPYSVVSTRSRRQQAKRYMVRHTLSTTQQVNAHPSIMLKNLYIGIEQERHMHKLTSQNLRAVHNWLLFLPSILFSLIAGVFVLIFEADLDASDDVRVYASISVGILSLLSVFWQALSKQLELGIRGTMHDATSGALKRLSEDVLLTLSSTENIPSEYVALVGEKFGQALDSCPSTVPYRLETAFSAVSDRMVLMLKPPMGQPPRKYVQKLDYMRLYTTAYDELATEIIHYWAWPFAFPQPREASDSALRNFKRIITEGRDTRRKGFIRCLCPCLDQGAPVERSLFDVVPPASVADTNASPNSNKESPYLIRNHMLGQEV